jgi:putative membrane protein
MRQVMTCALLGLALLGLAAAQGDESGKGLTDEAFVLKASEGGLAEVNMGKLAAKSGSDQAVKEFARMMVKDHTKANKELASLADKKGFKVAKAMDDDHKKDFDKLSKLSGADFDGKYMEGQVKGHELMVAIFEKQSKGGKDEDVKAWAEKTLPTVKMHLKMAKEAHKKVKGSDK